MYFREMGEIFSKYISYLMELAQHRDPKGREQFHSNIVGQSVTLYREEVRQRITELTNYFLSHGVSDPAAAQHQAIAALGNIVKRQALIMGFSDTFALMGVVLAVAAVALLLAGKVKVGAAGGAAH
jgi:MFS transporter, DHA2 family, multidrug resistance protein